ncbi:organic cation transporter protein-like [Tubulanus polymorphus]|uniref:organic cation transporter protein-like n=1 Tax=Tubulanus polymorphus TaxID=672921 RepID=UPI003DA43017
MYLDQIIVRIGEFGQYQIRQYVMLMLPVILITCQMMATVFTVYTLNYRCATTSKDYSYYGPSLQNMSSCVETGCDNHCSYAENKITQFKNTTNVTNTRKCRKWLYDNSIYGPTAVTEFNLVCDRQYLRALPSTGFMVGVLISSLTLSYLADRFGRKNMVLVGLILQGAAGLMSAWVPEIYSFVVLRGITAMGNNAMYSSIFVLGMELVGPSKRPVTGIGICLVYSIGYVVLSALAYGITHWRHLQTAISCLSALLIPFLWFIPESVHWLITHGKADEAEEILRRAAVMNGRSFPNGCLQLSKNDREPAESSRSVPLTSIFRHKRLAIRTTILMFNWFVISGSYYGLTLNSGTRKGNVYINLLISGVVEAPAYVIVILTLNRFGRKKVHCFSMLMAGASLLSTMFIGIFSQTDMYWLITTLATLGKFGTSAAYSIIYLYTGELYPTVARNATLGICSMFARFGSISGPYIAELGSTLSGKYAPVVPLVTFGTLAYLAGLFSLLLPETTARNLPQTIEDCLQISEQQRNDESTEIQAMVLETGDHQATELERNEPIST